MPYRTGFRYEKIDKTEMLKFKNICDDFDLLTKRKL